MKELIDKAAPKILFLYQKAPLYFYDIGSEAVMPTDLKSKEIEDQYEWLFTHLFSYSKTKETARVGSIGSEYYYRRSLEDIFLLAKHYIDNPSIYDVARFSKEFLSSNFCFSTGLLVYRPYGYYDGHNTCESDDKSKIGLLSSLWWYDEDDVLPSHLVNDYDELIEVIRLAEECAKQHPNFVAVGRGFQKKESTQ